ncbi:hypothetical protein EJB05_42892 [Eragrostis curvula]|uniref:Uncharacterized protein n=1 Tax=Eragrostis curvula TaxID=38414 RepID=A0A5J9TDG1_9POAL|nr:hypothetical protein EJB05_47218 [Eragrostis curvula]TVU09420.1 hypothetical protein EJB05_42892 [Eragrostis curvula]
MAEHLPPRAASPPARRSSTVQSPRTMGSVCHMLVMCLLAASELAIGDGQHESPSPGTNGR